MDLLMSVAFAFVSAVLWATSDFFMTVLLKKGHSPEKILLYSQLIGCIALLVPYFMFFSAPLELSTTTIAVFLVAGLLNILSYVFFYRGLQVGKMSIVSPISSCWVVVTVALSVLFLSEPIDLQKGVAISLCVAGILLTSLKFTDLLLARLTNPYAGANFALMAALAWGLFFILLDILDSSLGWFLPVLIIRIISFFMISAYLGAKRQDLSISLSIVPTLIFIAVFDVLAFVAYSIAISSAYTSIIAPIGALFPLVSILFARLFLGERLNLSQKIGIALALIGVLILLS